MSDNLTTHVQKRLLTGLLTVLPLLITLIILQFLIKVIRSFFSPILVHFYPEAPLWMKYLASFSAVLILLYSLGLLTGHFLGRWFWGKFEFILLKIPLLRTIYSSSREMVQIFSKTDKSGFKEVVFIEFPRQGMKAIGFVTGTVRDEFGHLCYKIFIPTTPNPTTGFLEIVGAESVVRSSLSVEEGIRIIMSGGILGPETLRLHRSQDGPGPAEVSSLNSAPKKGIES